MKKTSLLALRFGLGLTFVWIGVLILKDPASWGSMVQPWALRLLPTPLVLMMQATALLDIVVGAMLLFGLWTWAAAALGFGHIVAVLVSVGVNDTTVRDIGLAAASLALAIETLPDRVRAMILKSKPMQK